jgi:hypothetical protein
MRANGLDQHYLTAGDGPLRRRQLFLKTSEKILRFGFPDRRLTRTLNLPKKDVWGRLGAGRPSQRIRAGQADGSPEEVEMTSLTVACFFIGAPVAGLGLLELQARLEQWDQRRHADD